MSFLDHRSFRGFHFSLPIIFLFAAAASALPKNIILFIGGGMGDDQVEAASLYLTGAPGQMNFEKFPYHSRMNTESVNNQVTDSAASATAMATGVKVGLGVISKRIPGDGSDLHTVLEFFKEKNKKSGLVTTADVTDATPASFGGHSPDRKQHRPILEDFMHRSRPNVLFGASVVLTPEFASQNGYTVVKNLKELKAVNLAMAPFLYGSFSKQWYLEWEFRRLTEAPEQPSLSQMTQRALEALQSNPAGFFLMVENELPDNAGRNEIPGNENRTRLLIEEVKALADAVQAAQSWAKTHPDTLIIVTADHETGDFSLLDRKSPVGVVPQSRWGSAKPSKKKVSVYGWGNGPAEAVAAGVIQATDNTDIYKLLTNQWAGAN